MKKIVALFVMAFAWAGMHAQGFGVEAGLNFGSITESYSSHEYKYTGKTGLYVGLNYEYEVGENMYLHMGLAYSQYGGKYTEEDGWEEIKLNYLDIPFMFKYGFGLSDEIKAFAIGGPVFSMGLSGTYSGGYEDESESVDIKFDGEKGTDGAHLKSLNTGFRLGAGINYGNFEGGLYYTMGLSDISPYDDTMKTSLFSIILGYRFM